LLLLLVLLVLALVVVVVPMLLLLLLLALVATQQEQQEWRPKAIRLMAMRRILSRIAWRWRSGNGECSEVLRNSFWHSVRNRVWHG
jgi:hypothetical protein